MKRINTKSVRFRTTAGAGCALVALLIIAGLGINWFVDREIQRSFDATLLEQATDRAGLIDQATSIETLITPVGAEDVVAAVAADGTVLASAGLVAPETISRVPLGVSTTTLRIIEPGEGVEDEKLRVAVAESAGGVRVLVGNEGETASNAAAAVRNMLLAVIPLTALAGAVVAWLVTGRALNPVRQMRAELNDVVRAGDGQRVTAPGSGDEVDDLGTTINVVLDRLDQQNLRQRQFVADASHELKSPLANARAILDTADAIPDPSEYQRVAGAVGAELNRLRALVDDLLFLAQADEGAPRDVRPFDLADVVFDEAERVAATSQKHIDASGVVPVEVLAAPSEAARAIRNLVENAERFATERVTVAVREDNGMATVVISDDGPGIAAADRDTVFQRFGRIDADRGRTAGGTGLGLSIVASIATANGGSVVLADAPSGGAQFSLSFPTQAGG